MRRRRCLRACHDEHAPTGGASAWTCARSPGRTTSAMSTARRASCAWRSTSSASRRSVPPCRRHPPVSAVESPIDPPSPAPVTPISQQRDTTAPNTLGLRSKISKKRRTARFTVPRHGHGGSCRSEAAVPMPSRQGTLRRVPLAEVLSSGCGAAATRSTCARSTRAGNVDKHAGEAAIQDLRPLDGCPADHVRSYYAALNTGDAQARRRALHPGRDALVHAPPAVGRRGADRRAHAPRGRAPARGWQIEHLVEGDDEVVIEWTMAWDHPRSGERCLDRGAEFLAFSGRADLRDPRLLLARWRPPGLRSRARGQRLT